MKVNSVRKVAIIDMDGTLVDTIGPEQGKIVWKEKTGTDYPHKGWWSKRETLDINVFENNLYSDILSEYERVKSEEDTFVILCTGRIIPLIKQVKAILDKHGLEFDDVILNGDKRFSLKGGENDTLNYKVRVLSSLKDRFPELEEIEFWDDRKGHEERFREWFDKQKIKTTYHLVTREGNDNH
tara:strand:- start:2149 stop:2697 length:549 start_codon:yes stop_codon:yes gene_type:complete